MKVVIAQDKGESLPEAVLPEPPPLNHDLDYVLATWLQLKLHHIYPRSGGYDDQDDDLMQDWHTLNLYYARVESGQLTVFVAPAGFAGLRKWAESAG